MPCFPMLRHRHPVLLLCLAGLLQSCGQSGDLYLPEEKAPPQQQVQTEDASTQEKESREPED